ncbi:MAG: trypsin-like peptidase domain-containing protein [Bacteroidetes bacterium]|nr:trypsin-like peptidase domain-containing protein [Bacteroidota bacterium]
MRILIFLLYFAFSGITYSQSIDFALPKLIEVAKSRSLPVLARDNTFSEKEYQLGSGVLLGDKNNKFVVLTCEHVVAVKDTANNTIRYLTEIFVRMNALDDSIRNVQMGILYVDEKNDFAILGIMKNTENKRIIGQLDFDIVTLSNCVITSELSEGDPILYIGYPLKLGIDMVNHPLSRTGIISQMIPNTNYFLIDGFVQHGHSGSPVFTIMHYPESGEWWLKLIGITTSFPTDYGDLLQKVKYDKVIGVQTELNPGFSYVTSMNQIIPVLRDSLKMK